MAKPTGEPTHEMADGSIHVGPVHPRDTVTKQKSDTATANTIEWLDNNTEERNRHSPSTPHLNSPHASLESLVFQALRRYGDMHPGTVDGEVMMMFVEFANMVIEDLRSHPYWDNIEMDFYTHPQEIRKVPDSIMVQGLLYHYSVQQQSSKVEAYGPMYFKGMNRVLYNRKFGNAPIEMSPWDRGVGNRPSGVKSYDTSRGN
jgi:hypothetical protein